MKPPPRSGGTHMRLRNLSMPGLSTTPNASGVPRVVRAHVAAYVVARCGIWPGPPPNPPSLSWQEARKATTWDSLGLVPAYPVSPGSGASKSARLWST
eukprot:scaffold267820_cov18-Prasinocladus_malaysianus.AAC.1